MRELKKSEFKDEVLKLGLTIDQQPATPAVVGKLFDEIDTDRSGYLDLKEAKAALKKWSGWSGEAYAEQRQKEAELGRLKALAARKFQEAMRPPAVALPPMRLPAPAAGVVVPEEELEKPPASHRLLSKLASKLGSAPQPSERLSKRARAEAKAEAARREVELAEHALSHLTATSMARGFRAWAERAGAQRANHALLARAARRVLRRESARALRTWQARAREGRRIRDLLELASRRVQHFETLIGFNAWHEVAVDAAAEVEALAAWSEEEEGQMPHGEVQMAPSAALSTRRRRRRQQQHDAAPHGVDHSPEAVWRRKLAQSGRSAAPGPDLAVVDEEEAGEEEADEDEDEHEHEHEDGEEQAAAEEEEVTVGHGDAARVAGSGVRVRVSRLQGVGAGTLAPSSAPSAAPTYQSPASADAPRRASRVASQTSPMPSYRPPSYRLPSYRPPSYRLRHSSATEKQMIRNSSRPPPSANPCAGLARWIAGCANGPIEFVWAVGIILGAPSASRLPTQR